VAPDGQVLEKPCSPFKDLVEHTSLFSFSGTLGSEKDERHVKHIVLLQRRNMNAELHALTINAEGHIIHHVCVKIPAST